MKKIDGLLHRLATSIHVSHGLEEDDLLRIDPSFSVEGLKTSGGDEDRKFFGEPVRHLKTNVMPASLVADPGVSQSSDNFHIRLFFLLLFLHLCLFNRGFNRLCHHLLFNHRWHHRDDGKVGIRKDLRLLHGDILDVNRVANI